MRHQLDGEPTCSDGAGRDLEHGAGVTGPAFGVERSCEARPEHAPAPTPATWIQIEANTIIQGELENGELCSVLRSADDEWLLFESERAAGRRARRFMAQLARRDSREFARLVGGQEVLARWGLRRKAGPGTVKVSSLKAYLDLWLTDFASFYDIDGRSHPIEDYPIELEELLGFRPGVAYRRL